MSAAHPDWVPWAQREVEGWFLSADFGDCSRCGGRTIARDPQGQPHHGVCPRDMNFVDRRGDRKGVRI